MISIPNRPWRNSGDENAKLKRDTAQIEVGWGRVAVRLRGGAVDAQMRPEGALWLRTTRAGPAAMAAEERKVRGRGELRPSSSWQDVVG